MKKKLELKPSLYEILQIISINVFDKNRLNQLFSNTQLQYFKDLKHNQLEMFE